MVSSPFSFDQSVMNNQQQPDIRQFRASSLREALTMIRTELGPDAAILRTQEVPKPGFWNKLRGVSEVEITAAPSQTAGRTTVASTLPMTNAVDYTQGGVELQLSGAEEVSDRDTQASLNRLRSLFQTPKIETANSTPISHSKKIVNWPETCFELYNELLDADLETQIARDFVGQVQAAANTNELENITLLRGRMRRFLAQQIPVSGPLRIPVGQQRKVALIGPTGVGKTTTIAKLAANSRLRDQRRVGLITMDTFRIAAVEQLRTYAEIIDLPLAVVNNAAEIEQALERMRDLELVLVDTAGRSPRNSQQLQELQSMLRVLRPDETHLVQSCTSSLSQLVQTAELFRPLNYTHLMLTKLDEALSMGSLFQLTRQIGLPISYLTTGQNVPDDIEIAESDRIVDYVLACATQV
jgi:flagellar biosynthesis protein FlhF